MSDQAGTSILRIHTLGGLALHIDDQPLTALSSRKAQALLIYLARTQRPHAREVLAELLWFERAPERALSNLRGVLHSLRKHLDPYVSITRETIAADSEHLRLDANALDQALAPLARPGVALTPKIAAQAAEALDLYQGEFLLGFPAGNSRGFEEWLTVERERLHGQVLEGLQRLIEWYLQHAEYAAGIAQARRLLRLDPLLERGHRQLMRLLAFSDQRQAALAQYKSCREILEEELGFEPEEETSRLFEQIRDDELEPPEVTSPAPTIEIVAYRPGFLDQEGDSLEPPVFVARESELAQLDGVLDAVLAGNGQPIFLAGEAGAGKTAMLEAFARRVQGQHPELLVALGQCNVQSGLGDPYLPFRQLLAMLTGDVEAQWSAGLVSRQHATRLWEALPEAARAILDHGPDLLGSFLPADPFMARLAGAAQQDDGLLARLIQLHDRARDLGAELEQSRYFEQYTAALQSLAARHPLLIILDDLQWVDAASTNLLFHLGRNLAGARVLLLGAFRPDELALGRTSASTGQTERHPLQKTLDEFKRTHGEVFLNLDRQETAEGLAFVEAFLDTEPNRLGADFRHTLARHTNGHPLFTVELLRAMQERDDLVKDPEGRWIEESSLDWDALPARVEGVIKERINRLEEELRDILSVASVEGEDFTAQVVARVQEVDERGLVRRLSRELDKKHRLIGERGTQQVGAQPLYLYRFRHSLFQRHLYNGLGEIERQILHRDVGEVLEKLYEGHEEEIDAQLAWHFKEGGDTDKAIQYLQKAGDRARLFFALEEAIQHYLAALAIQKEVGDFERAARTLMKLGLTYHNLFKFQEARDTYNEAFKLLQKVEPPTLISESTSATHRFRNAYINEPTTLDPARIIKLQAVHFIEQLFSGLVALNMRMDIVPDVADRWEILDGGRRYIFHIRKNVSWSDGVQLTAYDFEFAWKRLLERDANFPKAQLLHDIKGAKIFDRENQADPGSLGISVHDEHTLSVELEHPSGQFLYVLANVASRPVPRHIVDKYGEDWSDPANIVTNGPFVIKEWKRNNRILLERNPAYHGSYEGNLYAIEWQFVETLEDFWTLYLKERLDYIPFIYLPPEEQARMKRLRAEDILTVPFFATTYIVINANHPPFDDIRVRQAFVMAINREAFTIEVFGGLGEPGMNGLVPPGMPGYASGIGLPYDPASARKLLKEAGFPKGARLPRIRAMHVADPDYDPFCAFLSEGWQHILGAEIIWDKPNSPQNQMGAWPDHSPPHIITGGFRAWYPDPHAILSGQVRQLHVHSNWKNNIYRKLITQAGRSTEPDVRMKLYIEAQEILINDASIVPLFHGNGQYLLKPRIKRIAYSAFTDWIYKDIVIEPH